MTPQQLMLLMQMMQRPGGMQPGFGGMQPGFGAVNPLLQNPQLGQGGLGGTPNAALMQYLLGRQLNPAGTGPGIGLPMGGQPGAFGGGQIPTGLLMQLLLQQRGANPGTGGVGY